METTLQPGDRVMVNRLAYVGASPGTGDIIVFDAGADVGHRGRGTVQPDQGRAALDRRGHRIRTLERAHPHQARHRHPRPDRRVLQRRRQAHRSTANRSTSRTSRTTSPSRPTRSTAPRRPRSHPVLRRRRGARRLVPDARRQPRQLVGLRRILPRRRRVGRLLAVGDEARYRRQGRSCSSGRSPAGAACRRRHVRESAPCRLLCGTNSRRQEAPDDHADDSHRRSRVAPPRPRMLAERALRRSELERSQSRTGTRVAPATMCRFDEARRAELRAAYADAAAAVERHQRAFDRARAIEQAAEVLADALTRRGAARPRRGRGTHAASRAAPASHRAARDDALPRTRAAGRRRDAPAPRR